MVVLLSCPNLIFVAAICLPPKTLYALVQAVLRDPEVGPCRPPNEFLLICDLPSKRSKMLSPEKTIRVKNDNIISRYCKRHGGFSISQLGTPGEASKPVTYTTSLGSFVRGGELRFASFSPGGGKEPGTTGSSRFVGTRFH